MNVKTLCLAILNLQDATGYEIKKLSTEGCFQHFVEISYGSIYPALAKLEHAGLVTCQTEAQDGKPDRKVYSITDAGRAEFVLSINVMPKPDKYISEFLLLSINADIAKPEILEAAFEARIAQYQGELQMLNELIDGCEQPALLWTARYGIATIEAKIAYISQNKQELLQMTNPAEVKIPSLQSAD